MKISKDVRAFLSAIGAKGGAAGKGSDLRRELNRKAVQVRWAKHKKRAVS